MRDSSKIFDLRRISGEIPHTGLPFSLSGGEVQLWCVDLDAALESNAPWKELLSSDERQRAARFHFERDRQYYSTTRAVLRTLLSRYLEVNPQELNFEYSDKGKPSLASPHQACGIAFNVSHSGEFALLGFTRRSHIGVDIEKIRHDFDSAAIAARFFSTTEQNELAGLPSDEQHTAFFRCWTRKEAFIKALGEGLSHPLSQFDVSLVISGPLALTTRPDGQEADRWWLQSVDVDPRYTAAFAVSSQ